MIPGIKSISAIQLPTRSFYAMDAAIQKFKAISFMRGGRLAGYLDDNRTTFYISKKLQDTTFINEEGQSVTAPQWVIDLEAPIDVAELLLSTNDSQRAVARATASASILEMHSPSALSATDSAPIMPESVTPAGKIDIFAERIEEPLQAGTTTPAASASTKKEGTDGQFPEIRAALDELGVDHQMFMAYADGKFGEGWRRNANGQRSLMQEINSYRGNPQGLVDLIANALVAA